MQCSVGDFGGAFAGVFICLYALITVLGIVRIFQTGQYGLDKARAQDREMGVKPGCMVDEQRKFLRIIDGGYSITWFLQRMYKKNVAIVLAVVALIVAVLGQWSACFG